MYWYYMFDGCETRSTTLCMSHESSSVWALHVNCLIYRSVRAVDRFFRCPANTAAVGVVCLWPFVVYLLCVFSAHEVLVYMNFSNPCISFSIWLLNVSNFHYSEGCIAASLSFFQKDIHHQICCIVDPLSTVNNSRLVWSEMCECYFYYFYSYCLSSANGLNWLAIRIEQPNCHATEVEKRS